MTKLKSHSLLLRSSFSFSSGNKLLPSYCALSCLNCCSSANFSSSSHRWNLEGFSWGGVSPCALCSAKILLWWCQAGVQFVSWIVTFMNEALSAVISHIPILESPNQGPFLTSFCLMSFQCESHVWTGWGRGREFRQ